MMERASITVDSVPAIPRHVIFRFDAVRDAWVLLAPERALMPDDIAVEILKRCDGQRAVSDIVALLAAEFDAPPAEIAADVTALLQSLADKGYLSA
ncbi:MAG: pyrroloquinoline quinone biosynthesis peptide chaperone PqqD [Magnetospiraceae bacterium]